MAILAGTVHSKQVVQHLPINTNYTNLIRPFQVGIGSQPPATFLEKWYNLS